MGTTIFPQIRGGGVYLSAGAQIAIGKHYARLGTHGDREFGSQNSRGLEFWVDFLLTNGGFTESHYDAMDRVTAVVLTPAFEKISRSKTMLAYEYRYDHRGRVVEKILPGDASGGVTVRCWYDRAVRTAYVQDAALGSRYRFFLYDRLGRLCVQGTCGNRYGQCDSRLAVTSYAGGSGGICQTGYTAPYTIYDPNLGRFLSPDNYVQAPDDSQSFNRYSYCLNNPLKYTDPTGEVWWVPAIIGAAVGIYSGGVIANHGEYNPTKWNWSSSKTWGFILGGGIVGAASGAVGGLVASSGIPFANTASIAASSLLYSAATNLYTNGAVPISISFGAFSYNFSDKEFGFLGKKGNEWMENLDYLVGSIGNLSDILTGFKPQKVDLVTEHSDLTGHSAIVEHGTKTGVGMDDINGIVSVGPDLEDARSWHWKKGTNTWNTHSSIEDIRWINSIFVNRKTINNYASWLNYLESRGKLIYSVELSSCVTHTSIALNLSGLFNIDLHPYLLNAQMYLWSNGVRPWLISSFLRNRYR